MLAGTPFTEAEEKEVGKILSKSKETVAQMVLSGGSPRERCRGRAGKTLVRGQHNKHERVFNLARRWPGCFQAAWSGALVSCCCSFCCLVIR